jgi:hypothetical protein
VTVVVHVVVISAGAVGVEPVVGDIFGAWADQGVAIVAVVSFVLVGVMAVQVCVVVALSITVAIDPVIPDLCTTGEGPGVGVVTVSTAALQRQPTVSVGIAAGAQGELILKLRHRFAWRVCEHHQERDPKALSPG